MKCERVNFDLLVRAMDDELSAAEAEWVPAHMAQCAACCSERETLELVSANVNTVVDRTPVIGQIRDRHQLAALNSAKHTPALVMRRFGWGMAIAATLAIGIIVAPKHGLGPADGPASRTSATAANNAIEVDGETFVALPYRILIYPQFLRGLCKCKFLFPRWQTLASVWGMWPTELSNQDRTVLADVLMGADGQPLGVHVVSWE